VRIVANNRHNFGDLAGFAKHNTGFITREIQRARFLPGP
jgi:hypothetical protein